MISALECLKRPDWAFFGWAKQAPAAIIAPCKIGLEPHFSVSELLGDCSMPFYEYQCQACGHEFEKLQKLSDDVLRDCPSCGEPELKKLVSAAAFRLKGTGWYATDFKDSGKKKNESGKDAKSDRDVKTDKDKSGKNAKSTSSGSSAAGGQTH